MIYPPCKELPPAQLTKVVESAPPGAGQRIWVEGLNIDGKEIRKGVLLPLG